MTSLHSFEIYQGGTIRKGHADCWQLLHVRDYWTNLVFCGMSISKNTWIPTTIELLFRFLFDLCPEWIRLATRLMKPCLIVKNQISQNLKENHLMQYYVEFLMRVSILLTILVWMQNTSSVVFSSCTYRCIGVGRCWRKCAQDLMCLVQGFTTRWRNGHLGAICKCFIPFYCVIEVTGIQETATLELKRKKNIDLYVTKD